MGMTNAASRAVGLANGRNPIPIVIPCHRVIGADGSLTGYGGGVERKQVLLALEQDALFYPFLATCPPGQPPVAAPSAASSPPPAQSREACSCARRRSRTISGS